MEGQPLEILNALRSRSMVELICNLPLDIVNEIMDLVRLDQPRGLSHALVSTVASDKTLSHRDKMHLALSCNILFNLVRPSLYKTIILPTLQNYDGGFDRRTVDSLMDSSVDESLLQHTRILRCFGPSRQDSQGPISLILGLILNRIPVGRLREFQYDLSCGLSSDIMRTFFIRQPNIIRLSIDDLRPHLTTIEDIRSQGSLPPMEFRLISELRVACLRRPDQFIEISHILRAATKLHTLHMVFDNKSLSPHRICGTNSELISMLSKPHCVSLETVTGDVAGLQTTLQDIIHHYIWGSLWRGKAQITTLYLSGAEIQTILIDILKSGTLTSLTLRNCSNVALLYEDEDIWNCKLVRCHLLVDEIDLFGATKFLQEITPALLKELHLLIQCHGEPKTPDSEFWDTIPILEIVQRQQTSLSCFSFLCRRDDGSYEHVKDGYWPMAETLEASPFEEMSAVIEVSDFLSEKEHILGAFGDEWGWYHPENIQRLYLTPGNQKLQDELKAEYEKGEYEMGSQDTTHRIILSIMDGWYWGNNFGRKPALKLIVFAPKTSYESAFLLHWTNFKPRTWESIWRPAIVRVDNVRLEILKRGWPQNGCYEAVFLADEDWPKTQMKRRNEEGEYMGHQTLVPSW